MSTYDELVCSSAFVSNARHTAGSQFSKRLRGAKYMTASVAFIASVALMNTAAQAQTAENLEAQYTMEVMEQALKTKQHYDLYGLHFAVDQATIQADAQPLLDDIATALENFPDWRLRSWATPTPPAMPSKTKPCRSSGPAPSRELWWNAASMLRGWIRPAPDRCARSPAMTRMRADPSMAGSNFCGSPIPRRPSDCSRRYRITLPRKPRYVWVRLHPRGCDPGRSEARLGKFRRGDAQPAGQGSCYALRRLRLSPRSCLTVQL